MIVNSDLECVVRQAEVEEKAKWGNIVTECVILLRFVIVQNPKFQEPVTLDFLDAELEDEIKVEVRMRVCSTRLIGPF